MKLIKPIGLALLFLLAGGGVFGDLVFETLVPRNVRLAEAPSFGRPIHAYDLRSRGSQACLQLGREYLERMGKA